MDGIILILGAVGFSFVLYILNLYFRFRKKQINNKPFSVKLRETNRIRSNEWGGDKKPIRSQTDQKLIETLFRAVELGGEVGEALNEAKKLARGYMGMKGSKPEKDAVGALEEELADVIICTDRLAELFDIDLDDAVVKKFNKTSDKYGLKTKLEK